MTKAQILGRWKRLEIELSARGIEAREIILALRELYSVYDKSMLKWLGSLFDSDIGGFYYSDSAAENDGFFPDIESTGQAIGILEKTGIINSYRDIPETVRSRIACFICSCEDSESGYFYNPQWSREDTDKKISRRSRDSRWAVDIAKMCNFEVPYPTVFAKIESGSRDNLPDYLKTKENFVDFLYSLDVKDELYRNIHMLVSQFDQILKLGYTDVAIDFMESLRNPETHRFCDENASKMTEIKIIRGVTCFYYLAGRKMPYCEECADLAAECIDDGEFKTMADISACWDAFAKSVCILSEFGSAEEKKKAEAILKKYIAKLPDYICNTAEALTLFKKSDSSFSYNKDGSSLTSQGMVVSKGTNEGDVNGTILAVDIPSRIISLLSLRDDTIPIYDFDDFELFLKSMK